MCASASGVGMVGRRVTGLYRPCARIVTARTGTSHVRSGQRFPMPQQLEQLLNDTEALQHELQATGLPCYDEYFERLKLELTRVITAKQEN